MKALYCIALIFSIVTPASLAKADEQPRCTDNDQTIERWREVRANAKQLDANKHALALVSCLASPNPELRDQIAYEVLTYWLRQDKLDPEVIYNIKEQLLPWLNLGAGESGGPHSFARAFAALILSELVRDDRRHTRWQGGDIDELLTLATNMFRAERDYRGLDSEYGWIHTIAHGSDLLWRLSLHPKTLVAQQGEILDAISSQLNNLTAPAFVFNEADRLARPVASIFFNTEVKPDDKINWIESLAKPAPWDSWNTAFASVQGMARLHNTKHFLRALNAAIIEYDNDEIKQALSEALAQLP